MFEQNMNIKLFKIVMVYQRDSAEVTKHSAFCIVCLNQVWNIFFKIWVNFESKFEDKLMSTLNNFEHWFS